MFKFDETQNFRQGVMLIYDLRNLDISQLFSDELLSRKRPQERCAHSLQIRWGFMLVYVLWDLHFVSKFFGKYESGRAKVCDEAYQINKFFDSQKCLVQNKVIEVGCWNV